VKAAVLRERFRERAGLAAGASLREWVEAVRVIPYGRPSLRSAEGVVEEWRGTCSTKHALLAALLEPWPELRTRQVHRVYRVTPEGAVRWGQVAVRTVPPEGLVDVHTYVRVMLEGRRTILDVTFPGAPWDGRSDMAIACEAGEDFEVAEGADASAMKAALVARYCDPRVREPFIAALSRV